MRHPLHSLIPVMSALLACGGAWAAMTGSLPAVVHKASVEVRAEPSAAAPAVATLRRDARVGISGQQGLWYRLELEDGRSGYVRVNEVRMAQAEAAAGATGPAVLLQGRAGRGRVTETATVRGIEASDLAAGRHDARGVGHRRGRGRGRLDRAGL